MFDLTPHITLSNRKARLYTYMRVLLYGVFILCSTFVLYKIIFPAAYFSFDFTKPRALTNTIFTPRTTENIVLFTAVAIGTFDTAKVTLTFDAPENTPTDAHLSVKKGYSVALGARVESDYGFYAPQQPPQTHPIRSGVLFSHRNGVWVVDKSTIRPIADATTLLAKGWSFDDVRTLNKNLLTNYTKGRMFTLKDPHPDGTLFYERDTDTFYIYNAHDNILHAISRETVKQSFPQNPLITIESANRTTLDTCTLHRSALPWRRARISCTVRLDDLKNLLGTEYQFAISGIRTHNLRSINVTLMRAPTIANAHVSLALIKQRLLHHYTQH